MLQEEVCFLLEVKTKESAETAKSGPGIRKEEICTVAEL